MDSHSSRIQSLNAKKPFKQPLLWHRFFPSICQFSPLNLHCLQMIFFSAALFFFVVVKDLLKYDIDFLYEICKSTLNYQRKNVGTLLSFCSSSVFGTYSLFCFNVGETLHLKVRNLEWHLWSGAKKKVYMCIKAQVRKKSVNLLSYHFAFLTKV